MCVVLVECVCVVLVECEWCSVGGPVYNTHIYSIQYTVYIVHV